MRRYGVLMTAGLLVALLSACGESEGEGGATQEPVNEAAGAAEPEEEAQEPDAYGAISVISTPDLFVTGEVEGREDCDVRSSVPQSIGADYDDLDESTQVVFSDASGAIVATTGLWVLNDGVGGCVWMVDSVDIPAGGEFYTATMEPWESAVVSESEVDEDGRLHFVMTHPDD